MLLPLLLLLTSLTHQDLTTELTAPQEAQWLDLTRTDAPQSAHPLKLYDISDLFDLTPTISPSVIERREAELAEFVEQLQAKLHPGLRQQIQRLELTAPASLILQASPAVHTFVEGFVTAQRQNQDVVFQVRFTMFRLPHGLLEDKGVEGSSMLFQDDASYLSMAEWLDEHAAIETLSAPQLALFPRALATVSMTNQIAYVADYELRVVQPGDQEILDPVIKVAEDGLHADVRVVPMPDGTFDLECNASFAELDRPLQSRKVRMGAGAGFEVEVTRPVIQELRISSLLGMTPGAAALIATTSEDRKLDFATLIHFDRIEVPLAQPNERVAALFESLRAGEYAYRWFPPLKWGDIPALLIVAEQNDAVRSFPRSPLGEVRPPQVLTGAVALWLIEGLREDGHIPSFAPLLVETGKELDASPATQRELLARAHGAYQRWWQALLGVVDAPGTPSPLEAVGLRWY